MSKETEMIMPQNTGVISNPSGLMIDANDIDIPRVNVVQKISDIEAPNGSLVLDKKYVLLKPEETGQVIVVSAAKAWKEDIPYDNDGIPRIVNNPDDAKRLALDSEWPILEFADIVLMFKQPEGNKDDEAYAFPIGDNNYAMAKLYVAKDAYRRTFKCLATFAVFNRNTPIQSRIWDFQTQSIEKGRYSWYIPTLKATNQQTPEAVAEFLSSFNA
jgi:hypothetical protein